VLSVGATPRTALDTWDLTSTGGGRARVVVLDGLPRPAVRDVHRDIHCVTKWSKLGTTWTGVSLDTLLDGVDVQGDFVTARSDGGYTTNLDLADLRGGRAWVVHEFDGEPLAPEHGGPARLLVPHLYFWKSAKWLRGLQVTPVDVPGFWETAGYHNHADPWREQRYWND
jgi:DMSO/TMAO reductase YedYZ molybdopterin-dependent catalytic subunit